MLINAGSGGTLSSTSALVQVEMYQLEAVPNNFPTEEWTVDAPVGAWSSGGASLNTARAICRRCWNTQAEAALALVETPGTGSKFKQNYTMDLLGQK